MFHLFVDKKFADINDKPLGQKFRGKNGYVPRADRYNNLLDTAYADIVEKRRSAPQNLETIKKVEKKQDNLNQPQNISAPVTSKTPTVSLKLRFIWSTHAHYHLMYCFSVDSK